MVSKEAAGLDAIGDPKKKKPKEQKPDTVSGAFEKLKVIGTNEGGEV